MVTRGEGLDHCYDCRAEIEILYRYILDFAPPRSSTGDVFEKVAAMSKTISRSIPGRRTLLDTTPNKEKRKENIRRSQYDKKTGLPAHAVAGWHPPGVGNDMSLPHELTKIMQTIALGMGNIHERVSRLEGDVIHTPSQISWNS